MIATAVHLAPARAVHLVTHDITGRLATLDPLDATWQLDLMISHERLGDTLLELGEPDKAEAEYLASLNIVNKLITLDRENQHWQHRLELIELKLRTLRLADAPATTTDEDAGGRRPESLELSKVAVRDSMTVTDGQQLSRPTESTHWNVSERTRTALKIISPLFDDSSVPTKAVSVNGTGFVRGK